MQETETSMTGANGVNGASDAAAEEAKPKADADERAAVEASAANDPGAANDPSAANDASAANDPSAANDASAANDPSAANDASAANDPNASMFDETDDLFDAIPAPPPAVRGCSLPALPPLEMTESPAPQDNVPNDPYAAYRTHRSLDRPDGDPRRAGMKTPDVTMTDAPPLPPGTELQPLGADGADAGEGKEPATWRSKSKPPIPLEPPAKAPPDPRKRGPRTPPGGTPTLDLDSEPSADIAPIGPTETASTRLAPPIPEPKAATPQPALSVSAEDIKSQISDLEARLDRLIRQSRESRGAAAGSTLGSRAPEPARRDPAQAPSEEDEAFGVSARELFSTDFYLRQWGRMGMRNRSEEVDEFGLDPKYEARYAPFFDFLYKHYFRVDTEGAENIPAEGRCLIVSNHSGGALPYDGIMLRTTLRHEHPSRRELRWLAEDFIYYLPFVGAVMNRIGAVRACQENAERLLDRERLVAVFPEGAKGTGKLYRERYRLQRFGRGGFIRLCLRTRTPLVPCAIIGAEEANPMLYRIEYMTKALGIPYLPITPTFPALGPLGLLPAPTKWKIRFGEPVRFDEYGPEAADDEILVGRLAERVRGTVQGLIDKTLAERKSIWFG